MTSPYYARDLLPEGFLVTHDGPGSNFNVYDWRDLIAAGLDGGTPSESQRPAPPVLLP